MPTQENEWHRSAGGHWAIYYSSYSGLPYLYRCEHCGLTYRTPDGVEDHLKAKHGVTLTGSEPRPADEDEEREESFETGSGWQEPSDAAAATDDGIDPSLLCGPYADPDLRLIDLANDGTWRLWLPFCESLPDLGKLAVAGPDQFTRRGPFYFYAQDEYDRRRHEGRLADVPDVADPDHRLILVYAPERVGWNELESYAVQKAAEFCGRPELLTRYHRQPDGGMVCPHCGKVYLVVGPFGSHLSGHGDKSGELYVESGDYLRRFGQSVRAWQKIQAGQPAPGAAA